MVASLEELGIYVPLLGRRLDDGTVELIDGHLRRTIFARVGPDTLVPIVLCDLNEAEAKKANLLHDPLAGLAEVDREKLDGLLREVQTGSEDLAGVMDELAKNAGLVEKGKSDLATRADDQPNTQYLIHVVCESEEHQAEVIEEITKMGLECKSLIF